METFSALLAICAGNSPVPGEFPAQRPVTRSFDVFFDLRLNKRLNKQSSDWWFETLSRPLWRHSNVWYWRIDLLSINNGYSWKEVICVLIICTINSSPPSAAYMSQWTGSSLVQVMACRLFDAKPLPEPMLPYCQLVSWEHILVKFEDRNSIIFIQENAIENVVCQSGGHFVEGDKS